MKTTSILFLIVLLIHLLYDFHWQGDFIATNKGKRIFILVVHCLTWGLFIWLAGYFLADWHVWKLAFLFVTHFASDYWKSHQPQTERNFYFIYIDQTVHLASIIVTVFA